MKGAVATALQQEFTKWEGSAAGPIPPADILKAEATLHVTFPDDYKQFIQQFGGAVVRGVSIFGLRQPALMPDEPSSVIDQSIIFRSELPSGYGDIVVISVDDSGNPIGFLPPDPTIFVFDHNFGGKSNLAATFEDYLLRLLATST